MWLNGCKLHAISKNGHRQKAATGADEAKDYERRDQCKALIEQGKAKHDSSVNNEIENDIEVAACHRRAAAAGECAVQAIQDSIKRK